MVCWYWQQPLFQDPQTDRKTMPSLAVGCVSFIQTGAWVPQWCLATQDVGILTPAGGAKRYQTSGRFWSQLFPRPNDVLLQASDKREYARHGSEIEHESGHSDMRLITMVAMYITHGIRQNSVEASSCLLTQFSAQNELLRCNNDVWVKYNIRAQAPLHSCQRDTFFIGMRANYLKSVSLVELNSIPKLQWHHQKGERVSQRMHSFGCFWSFALKVPQKMLKCYPVQSSDSEFSATHVSADKSSVSTLHPHNFAKTCSDVPHQKCYSGIRQKCDFFWTTFLLLPMASIHLYFAGK